MPTAAENLVVAYNQLAAALAACTLNPQPSYSSNGRSVSHTEFRAGLIRDMGDLRKQIVLANGRYLVRSRGRSV